MTAAAPPWIDPRGAAIERLDPLPLVPRAGAFTRTTLTRADVVDEGIFQPHRVQRGMGIEGIIHRGTGAKRDDVDADTEIFLTFVDTVVHEQASRPTGPRRCSEDFDSEIACIPGFTLPSA